MKFEIINLVQIIYNKYTIMKGALKIIGYLVVCLCMSTVFLGCSNDPDPGTASRRNR